MDIQILWLTNRDVEEAAAYLTVFKEPLLTQLKNSHTIAKVAKTSEGIVGVVVYRRNTMLEKIFVTHFRANDIGIANMLLNSFRCNYEVKFEAPR